MKRFCFLLFSFPVLLAQAQPVNPSEGYPDKELSGNYVVIRISSFCNSKAEAVSEMMKFKVFCDENTYLKFYTQNLGYWQVKSSDKAKDGKWIGGYCNARRQNKELYEMDRDFLRMYCENAEVWQFKDILINSVCPREKLEK